MPGLDDLDRAVQALSNSLSGAALEPLVRHALAPTAEHARRHVAVETGQVRDAIAVTGHHTEHSATGSVQVLGSAPGGPAHEAVFLEYGTSKMAAEPFMRPAIAATGQQVANTIAAGIAGIVKQHE